VIDFPTCADEDFKSPEALVTGPSAWTHSKNSPFKIGRTAPWSPLKGMEAIMLGNMRLIIGVMIALGMLIVHHRPSRTPFLETRSVVSVCHICDARSVDPGAYKVFDEAFQHEYERKRMILPGQDRSHRNRVGLAA
jgi:hypothetical protein